MCDGIVERIKGFLWHGNPFKALPVLGSVESNLAVEDRTSGNVTAARLYKAVSACTTSIEHNQGFLPNDGARYRNGERISTGCVESTVHSVVRTRMVQKPQMRWSQRGAHLLLHIRTRVLHGEWEETFRQWSPGFRTQRQPAAA